MGKRIRKDAEDFELRGAEVRVASRDYLCDVFQCPAQPIVGGMPTGHAIPKGATYAHINTGIKVCSLHWLPEDVENG